MAYEVVWSNEAVFDLESIAEFIKKDSPINAKIVVTKFFNLVSKYGLHPRLSTIVPEIGDELIRHKLVYGWRVIFKIDDKKMQVVILTIIHGKRQFNNLYGKLAES